MAQKHRLLLSVPGFIAGVHRRRLIGKKADRLIGKRVDGPSAKEPTVDFNRHDACCD
jgi:hypothetical protein